MTVTSAQKKHFTTRLVAWHRNENTRQLPWKGEQDPYKIWLSEIILQQTRALQGLPYYLKFITAYPTVHDMANAPDEDAFRYWQGLGYYNRCKNMLTTARYISKELKGKFPNSYEGLLALKGVGPYTAAAIASFAFGLPCAVVDGNVYRVLSRYFGIETPYDTTEGKIQFSSLASELLDKANPALYNQAIMDLGAQVCTPAQPTCDTCPLQQGCFAFEKQLTGYLPVKSKKVTVRTRYFNYILIRAGETIWINKRGENDIWNNLHEPYLIESSSLLSSDELIQDTLLKGWDIKASQLKYEGQGKQRLTHQIINSHFYTLQLENITSIDIDDGQWIPITHLKKIAFSKTILSFLEKKNYF